MQHYKQLITPLLSLVILTLGAALLTTFLSLRLHQVGANSFVIGGLSTAYYGGMVLGAFKLERIILRVGHIRAYSACASILAVSALLHGFYVNDVFWLFLRLIEGVATAGLYIVIESWILSSTDNTNRGSFLALYMVALYMAQSFGQWLLTIGHQETLELYAISAMFAALSVIPLSLTKLSAPCFSEPETLTIKAMFSMSPSGVAACLSSGLVLGSLYGLYPTYIQHMGFSVSSISTIMGLTILGGMLFQFPVGRLSDRVSRRFVLSGLAFLAVIVTAVILSSPKLTLTVMAGLSFLLGGVLFCIYPIAISHACDRVEHSQLVSATQTLLLSYGVGATVGPVLAPIGNVFLAGSGVLLFTLLVNAILGVFMLWRKSQAPSVPQEDKQDFNVSVEMTPVAIELDEALSD